MAFPLAAAGTFLGGVGTVLGALGVGKHPKDPYEAAAVAQDMALNQEARSFEQKMALAQEHGIHPLSMLGVPMSSSAPSISWSGNEGIDFRDLGYGINQAASAYVDPDTQKPAPVESRPDPAMVRLREAQARRAEAEAGLAEDDLARRHAFWLTSPGLPPGARVSNDAQAAVAAQSGIPLSMVSGGRDGVVQVEQKVAPPHPSRPGFAAADDQGWQRVRDKNGQPVPIVRQDAVQADIEKGATFQALANIFGIEDALKITAVMENEGLIIGTGVGLGVGAGKIWKWWQEHKAGMKKQRRAKEAAGGKRRFYLTD